MSSSSYQREEHIISCHTISCCCKNFVQAFFVKSTKFLQYLVVCMLLTTTTSHGTESQRLSQRLLTLVNPLFGKGTIFFFTARTFQEVCTTIRIKEIFCEISKDPVIANEYHSFLNSRIEKVMLAGGQF